MHLKFRFTSFLLFLFFVFQNKAGFAQNSIIVISGGGGPISNHSRYYSNIDRIAALFPKKTWQRAFLVADGRGDGLNMLTEKSSSGKLEFERQDPVTLASDDIYLAATQANLRDQLIAMSQSNPDDTDPLFIYVTDHGGVNETDQQRTLMLWGESLKFAEFGQLLDLVPQKSPNTLIFDECYGGAMIEALWSKKGLRRHSCGFAAASPYELAYSGGGLAKAMYRLNTARRKTHAWNEGFVNLTQVHQNLKRSAKPDLRSKSTPVSSTDLFYRKYIQSIVSQGGDLKNLKISTHDCLQSQEKFLPSLRENLELRSVAVSLCQDLLAAAQDLSDSKILKFNYAEAFERIQSQLQESLRLRAEVVRFKTSLGPLALQWIKANFPDLKGFSSTQRVSLETVFRDGPASTVSSEGASSVMTADAWAKQVSRLAFESMEDQFSEFLRSNLGSSELLDQLNYAKNAWGGFEKEFKAEKLFLNAFTNYVGFRMIVGNEDRVGMSQITDLAGCEGTL